MVVESALATLFCCFLVPALVDFEISFLELDLSAVVFWVQESFLEKEDLWLLAEPRLALILSV